MLDEIVLQNHWWKAKAVEPSKLGQIGREDLAKLKADLGSGKITCLIGPRQSGKTTLLYGLISHLIESGVAPERILFTSLDSPKIRFYLEKDFDLFIRDYANTVVSEPIDDLKSTIYVFLDEVHKLKDWGNAIKYWQDLGLKLKFIVSGSSAIRILKGSGESLLGRINFHTILPLKFSEFCGIKVDCNFMDLAKLKRAQDTLLLEKQKLMARLEEYILKGGFPEVFSKDYESAMKTLRQYKTLTITRDILDLKEIKESRILSDLTDLLADQMAERMNYSSFADVLKVKMDTVKNYITYLEEAFLVYTCYLYSKKQVLSTRKEKKMFFIDNGLRNSLILREINDLEKTKIVENVVFSHVLHMKKNELFPKIFYWMDKNRHEVDIVVQMDGAVIPIEVKYANRIDDSDLKGLASFCRRYGTKGLVITKDTLKEENGIIYIPAWLFLVMV